MARLFVLTVCLLVFRLSPFPQTALSGWSLQGNSSSLHWIVSYIFNCSVSCVLCRGVIKLSLCICTYSIQRFFFYLYINTEIYRNVHIALSCRIPHTVNFEYFFQLFSLGIKVSVRSVFSCSFFTAVVYTHISIHITHFHLCHSVNIYWNWFQEQFCNLSWKILYTPNAQ